MRPILIIACGVVVAAAAVVIPFVYREQGQHAAPLAEATERSGPPVELAALGRVEGRGETISVGAAADGVVKQVLVEDGQDVTKGALLAAIACDDISAEIDLAKAEAESARAARTRLLRGDREEEREAAARATDAAKAVMMQAQDHLNRMNALYQKAEISRDMFDQATRDFEVAQANYERAEDEQNLADAQPLPEEVSKADAEVAAAERNVNVATDKLEKCNVRAPISGTILKVLTKTGESYSTLLPHPLFTLADESVRRVRAEVDERDIAKVKIGQASIVTADAFPGEKFVGQVVEISQTMEEKSVLSDDPAQKTDRDVLDVVIELKPAKDQLPLGLQVTAKMTSATMPAAESSMDAPADSSALDASSLQANAASDPPKKAVESASENVSKAGEVDAARAVALKAGAPALLVAKIAPASAPAAPVTATKAAGFVLQAGAMTHTENATALADELKKKSFPAFVLTRHGDLFYRVDVGPYPDLASATEAKNQLSSGGFETILKHPSPDATRADATR
jgi:HlyD family secretion protein